MNYGLREVTEADLEMLREHRNRPDTRCWLGSDREITAEQQLAWWRLGGASSFRIAVVAGRDVGLVRVTDVGGSWACVGSDVFAAERGHGLGHIVFRAACERAEGLGARFLWLRVFIENTPAVRIYLRAGFVFVPDEEIEVFQRQVPNVTGLATVRYARMERGEP